MGLYSTDYKENDQQYKGDFKFPLTLGPDVSGYFKFGGIYRYSYHTNDQTTPFATPTAGLQLNTKMLNAIDNQFDVKYSGSTGEYPGTIFTTTDSKLLGTFLSDQFGQIYWAPNAGFLNSIVNYVASDTALVGGAQGGWQYGPFQQLANDYKYVEKYYAGYVMGNVNIGSKFMVVGGTRYEEDRSLFFAFNMKDTRDVHNQQAALSSSPTGSTCQEVKRSLTV